MSEYYDRQAEPADPPPAVAAVLAEYSDVNSVIAAAEAVRDAGYRRWDVHSPFPIHGIDKAMDIKPSKLPLITLTGGVVGFFGGLLLAWWTNAVDYPYLISGKPLFSLPANIPVIFETTILLAAFGAVFGMLMLNKLPLLYNPLFRSKRFARVTNDKFFVVIEADDPNFDAAKAKQLLESTHPDTVEEVLD